MVLIKLCHLIACYYVLLFHPAPHHIAPACAHVGLDEAEKDHKGRLYSKAGQAPAFKGR